MNINYIKRSGIFFSLILLGFPIFAANKSSSPQLAHNHPYYKPVTTYESPKKAAQPIGIYKRAKIGKDGAYGTFTQKGSTQSKTVLEHNPTTAPVVGVTNKTAVGYIINTNPGAGSNAGSPKYLGLYPYAEPLLAQKKAVAAKPSMKMKTAQYLQKK